VALRQTRCVVITGHESVRQTLEASLNAIGTVSIIRTLAAIPPAAEAPRFYSTLAPHIIFAEASINELSALVDQIRKEAHGIQVIALGTSVDADVLLELMQLGIREFLCQPFEQDKVEHAIARCRAILEETPPVFRSTNEVFTFIPAKSGVGCSTIALNVGAAIANQFGKRVLLADFDLNSGMQRFLLGLGDGYSVTDAVRLADTLDDSIWPQLVNSVGRLDVLAGGKPDVGSRIESEKLVQLLDFARRNYEVLFFDVSCNLEKYSVELMGQSKRIFLLCTPEVGPLHLAKEKLAILQSQGFGDRVSVILNRCPRGGGLKSKDLEQVLGRPPFFMLPNDYQEVMKALESGRVTRSGSALGERFTELAQRIIQLDDEAAPEPESVSSKSKRNMLEFFRAPPRYSER
jgi:pilus assembly protein CpaE